MKQSDEKNRSNGCRQYFLKELAAYHEAGHAAAIHFNNRLKKLPPIFFKIVLDNLQDGATVPVLKDKDSSDKRTSMIKGGRLIHTLPLLTEGLDTRLFLLTDEYHPAFEADIVNLLVGSLAEAKYIARMDNEPFKAQLLSTQTFSHYGGEADLALVYEYLQNYSADRQEQDQSLRYFLGRAFDFIDDQKNWQAVTKLANYILASNKNEISCEEAVAVLDSHGSSVGEQKSSLC